MIKIYNFLFESDLATSEQARHSKNTLKFKILMSHLENLSEEKSKKEAANFLKHKFPSLIFNKSSFNLIEDIKQKLKEKNKKDLPTDIKDFFKLRSSNLFTEKSLKDILNDTNISVEFSNDPNTQEIYYRKIIKYLSLESLDSLLKEFFLKY